MDGKACVAHAEYRSRYRCVQKLGNRQKTVKNNQLVLSQIKQVLRQLKSNAKQGVVQDFPKSVVDKYRLLKNQEIHSTFTNISGYSKAKEKTPQLRGFFW